MQYARRTSPTASTSAFSDSGLQGLSMRVGEEVGVWGEDLGFEVKVLGVRG